ncbi:membrane protein [Mycobacterium tuberculosis]|nr:membrane protein [Mycobacterium tuberculosis]
MYLIVDPAKDPTTPAALSLSLYVSSDYGGGYLVFAGDGTIKHVSYPS